MSSEREQALARGIDLVRREFESARSLPMADDEDDARAWAAVLAAVERRERMREWVLAAIRKACRCDPAFRRGRDPRCQAHEIEDLVEQVFDRFGAAPAVAEGELARGLKELDSLAVWLEGVAGDTERSRALRAVERVVEAYPALRAAAELALQKASFPVGAIKAKEALQEALAAAPPEETGREDSDA